MGLGERGGRCSGGKRKRKGEGGMGGKTVIGTEEMSPANKLFIEKIESYRYTGVSKVSAPPPIIIKSSGGGDSAARNPSFASPPPTSPSPRRGRGSISDITPPSRPPTSQPIREAKGNGPCASNNDERMKEEAVTGRDKATKKKKKKKAKSDRKGEGTMMGATKGKASTKSRKSEAKMEEVMGGLEKKEGRCSGRKREGGMSGETVIETEEMSPERKRFIDKIESYRYTGGSKVLTPPPPPPLVNSSSPGPHYSAMRNPSFTPPPPPPASCLRPKRRVMAPRHPNAVDGDNDGTDIEKKSGAASKPKAVAPSIITSDNKSGKRKKEEAVSVEDKAEKKKKAKPGPKGKGIMMGEDEKSGAKTKVKSMGKGKATTKPRKSEAKIEEAMRGSDKKEGGMSGETVIEMEEMSPEKKWFIEKIESCRYTGGSKILTPPPPPASCIPNITLSGSWLPPTSQQRIRKAAAGPLFEACPRPKRRVMAPRRPNGVGDNKDGKDNEKKSGAASKRKAEAPSTITSDDKSRKRKKEEAVAVEDKSEKNKKAKPGPKGKRTMMVEDEQSGAKTKGKRKGKGKATTKSKKPRSVLTAAEKRSDAYVRVPEDHPWVPPVTGIDLLQLPFHRDQWKVLVICILLNRTTGVQVTNMLEKFFKLCPNAETAKDVCDEKLRLVLSSLGLQKCRTKTIKRFSSEYLEGNWSYVTELHGIGKYAADAYAIVCAGKAEKVIPEDHRLVPYWKSVLEWKTTLSVIEDEKKGKFL